MVIQFCASCDWSLSEQELLSGNAVKVDRTHVYCESCVSHGIVQFPKRAAGSNAGVAVREIEKWPGGPARLVQANNPMRYGSRMGAWDHSGMRRYGAVGRRAVQTGKMRPVLQTRAQLLPKLTASFSPVERIQPAAGRVEWRQRSSEMEILIVVSGTLAAILLVAALFVFGGRKPASVRNGNAASSSWLQRPS